jgi:hypothetical protein
MNNVNKVDIDHREDGKFGVSIFRRCPHDFHACFFSWDAKQEFPSIEEALAYATARCVELNSLDMVSQPETEQQAVLRKWGEDSFQRMMELAKSGSNHPLASLGRELMRSMGTPKEEPK